MNIFNKPINFLKEVKQELTKVSWSTKQEIMASTVVIIVITGLMGIFIGVIDYLLAKTLTIIIA